MSIDALSTLATQRSGDLFLADLESHKPMIRERVGGSRILVIGGAGSIGAATVRALLPFGPQSLHVLDQSENNLAELVRDLRSRSEGLEVHDFRALPLDFGSPVAHRFLRETRPYDLVLNFAALKHVRSEKDCYSLLQMLDTNVVKQARFLCWLSEKSSESRYFSVSTDKAANPASLMGASKRIMEHVLFSGEIAPGMDGSATSARFANVAFSDGSLLDSFLRRLQKRQPLSVPRDTLRYFISLREAGQICLLASVCGPAHTVLIPRLDAANDQRDLESIAVAVLNHHGFEPHYYTDEGEARLSVESDLAEKRYPLLLTALDTSGEKPYEEFVADGEKTIEIGMQQLLAVNYRPTNPCAVADLVRKVEERLTQPELPTSKNEIAEWISAVVPEFSHVESCRNLDYRM